MKFLRILSISSFLSRVVYLIPFLLFAIFGKILSWEFIGYITQFQWFLLFAVFATLLEQTLVLRGFKNTGSKVLFLLFPLTFIIAYGFKKSSEKHIFDIFKIRTAGLKTNAVVYIVLGFLLGLGVLTSAVFYAFGNSKFMLYYSFVFGFAALHLEVPLVVSAFLRFTKIHLSNAKHKALLSNAII